MTIMLTGPDSATGTPTALITTRDARQRVLDAQFEFVRKAVKIALRSARANSEGLSTWMVLTASGTFDPTNYLPAERYRIRLTWASPSQAVEGISLDATPEQILDAVNIGIPELSDVTRTDLDGHIWSFEGVERTVTATLPDSEHSAEVLVHFDFTFSYVGSLMDGGITPSNVESTLYRYNGDYRGYVTVDRLTPLPLETVTPPTYAPGPGDNEPRYTEAQVQQQIDDAVAILKRQMGDVGMDGKREWNWCGQAEATLGEIGVPGFGDDAVTDESECDCEYCRPSEEASDVWVDFTVTRTIRVRARRVDSGELPDSTWVQSSIAHEADIEMDGDWDGVEVISVSDSVSDVFPVD